MLKINNDKKLKSNYNNQKLPLQSEVVDDDDSSVVTPNGIYGKSLEESILNKVHKNLNESYSLTKNLELVLKKFINKTGVHNGGDCASVAKYIGDYLSSWDAYDYSYSGEIVDGALGHVFVKFRNNYYDGVKGKFRPSGKIVDNLKDDGVSIGNDQVGWINYQYGSTSYKKHELYKKFMDIADEVDDLDESLSINESNRSPIYHGTSLMLRRMVRN